MVALPSEGKLPVNLDDADQPASTEDWASKAASLLSGMQRAIMKKKVDGESDRTGVRAMCLGDDVNIKRNGIDGKRVAGGSSSAAVTGSARGKRNEETGVADDALRGAARVVQVSAAHPRGSTSCVTVI